MTEAITEAQAPRMPRWLRWVATGLGLVLLAAAIITVARQHSTVTEAVAAMRHPSPGTIAVLLGTVVVNIALTATMFSLLMSRHGHVGRLEMQALIAAASLLNYLPLRPGLFGRIAWHKRYNEIPAMISVRVALQAMALTAGVAGYAVLALASTRAGVPLWLAAAAPLPLLLGGLAWPRTRFWSATALIRSMEITVFALRYHAAFTLLGLPVSAASALAFACISVAALLVPLIGNGLGIREWAVGLAAPLLTPYQLAQGLTADLVNRAAELVVVTCMGLSAMAWLAKKAKSE